VDMSAGLAADLGWLTDALDDPGTDLTGLVGSLHEAFLVAVPSGLGVAMTIAVSPGEVTVSTLDGAAGGVATSLRVPLGGWTDLGPGSGVVFYAATGGALVDLAADLGWLLDLGDDLVLDGHLRPGDHHGVMSGLGEMSVVQQAIGWLIDRGRTPRAARDELEQAARASVTPVHEAAAQLMRDAPSAGPCG
jgi:hypothetical protein